jgi:hypothetical protein
MTYLIDPFGASPWQLPGAALSDANGGNLAFALPAGHALNDLMVAALHWRGTQAFTPPAGWTVIYGATTGDTLAGGRVSSMLAFKVHTGTETNPVFARSGGFWAVGTLALFRAAGGVPTYDAFSQQELAVAGTAFSAPSLTLAAPNSLVFVTVGLGGFDGSSVIRGGFSAASMTHAPSPADASAVDFDATGQRWGGQAYNAITPPGVVITGLTYMASRVPAGPTGEFTGTALTSSRIQTIAAGFRIA